MQPAETATHQRHGSRRSVKEISRLRATASEVAPQSVESSPDRVSCRIVGDFGFRHSGACSPLHGQLARQRWFAECSPGSASPEIRASQGRAPAGEWDALREESESDAAGGGAAELGGDSPLCRIAQRKRKPAILRARQIRRGA